MGRRTTGRLGKSLGAFVGTRWAAYKAEAFDARLFVIRRLHLGGRGVLVSLVLCNLALGLLPVVFVVATSVLIGRTPAAVAGGASSPEWDALVRAFLVAAAAFFAQQLLASLVGALSAVMKHRVNGVFRGRLIETSLRSTGIGPLEDQAALANLRQASDQLETAWMSPGDAAAGTVAYLARYTSLLGFVVLVGVVASLPAALGIAACALSFRYGHRSGLRLYMRVWPIVGPIRRRREYFRDTGIRQHAAKELRVFGLTAWVVDRYREAALAQLQPLWDERRRMVMRRFVYFTVVGVVLASTVLALVVRGAARGDLTLTELALALQASIAAIVLGDYYAECDNQSQFGMLAGTALEAFGQQVDAYGASDVAAADAKDARGLPGESVRFADVSFSYPGAGRPVLDHLELTLRAGECTALVGLNGAGKTTLVKLLARLYEPTEGTLLIDGVNAAEFGVDSWRRQLAVIFQDFTRYELSAADNIAFGAVEHRDDEIVRRSAERAGISAALDDLPRGLDTLLARHYEDGGELSGGQWQRVAIARALYALDCGARVLVMDEPTSALDVRAEAEFFEQFRELTLGVTTLLISHRFSSVRHADRIVVLEQGRVIEDGTHDSLVASGGRYADLFTLQAERFAAGLDADGNPTDDRELV
jgi:ATP-binding cassette subfamily B protein